MLSRRSVTRPASSVVLGATTPIEGPGGAVLPAPPVPVPVAMLPVPAAPVLEPEPEPIPEPVVPEPERAPESDLLPDPDAPFGRLATPVQADHSATRTITSPCCT